MFLYYIFTDLLANWRAMSKIQTAKSFDNITDDSACLIQSVETYWF